MSQGNTVSQKIILLFLYVLFVISPLVAADETVWVIAAEEFTLENVSEVYADFARIIPSQLLVKLSGSSTRTITEKEALFRDLYILSEKRIQLVNERAKLVLSRDRVILSSVSAIEKKRQIREIERSIRLKEEAIADLDSETRDSQQEIESGSDAGLLKNKTEKTVKIWKTSGELYVRNPAQTLYQGLTKNGISALVTGTVRDVAGYVQVTVTLETGIYGMEAVTVSDAASWDDIDFLLSSLASRLLPGMTNTETVELVLSVEPVDSRVFIDGRLITDPAAAITVTKGNHVITAFADGYAGSEKSAVLDGSERYSIAISLEKMVTQGYTFTTSIEPSQIFINGKLIGETPAQAFLPRLPAIGEAINEDITTYFVFDPSTGPLVSDSDIPLHIRSNRTATEERIERQRKILYWSLGALYISLPVSMLSYGATLNRTLAIEDGRLAYNSATARELERWQNINTISQAVSIGLGVNFVVQLVRYLIAADQTLPETSESF